MSEAKTTRNITPEESRQLAEEYREMSHQMNVRNPEVMGGIVEVLPSTVEFHEEAEQNARRRQLAERLRNDAYLTDKLANAIANGTIKPVNPTLARMVEMLEEEKATMLAKNSDYANSDTDPLKNFRFIELAGTPALDGALARMSDKFIRVMNLRAKQKSGGTVGVPSEGMGDTLLDLSNYARICRLLLEEEEEEAAAAKV